MPRIGNGRGVRAQRRREAVAFDAVFEREFGPLHRYIRRRVGSDLADELAAETFTIALTSWRSRREQEVRPWLYGIATNQLRHHWRREERRLRAYARWGAAATGIDDPADAVLGRLDAQSQERVLASALSRLSRELRETVLLLAWAELTEGEIAAALGLPAGTVKSRLHRARAQLRRALHSGDEGVELSLVEEDVCP